jgi:hypothetical protein
MTVDEQILILAKELEKLGKPFAFLGGSALGILITDPAAAPVRATKDIDVLVNAPTRRAYTHLEEELRSLGFVNDTRDGAPMCRYLYGDTVIDILPTSGAVLGWDSRWFARALATAQPHVIAGIAVKLIHPAYFIATKLDAFKGRGRGDLLGSHDEVLSVFCPRIFTAYHRFS